MRERRIGNRTSESISVIGTQNVSGEEAESLLGENGALANGIRVAVPGLDDVRQLAFHEDLSNRLTNESCA